MEELRVFSVELLQAALYEYAYPWYALMVTDTLPDDGEVVEDFDVYDADEQITGTPTGAAVELGDGEGDLDDALCTAAQIPGKYVVLLGEDDDEESVTLERWRKAAPT